MRFARILAFRFTRETLLYATIGFVAVLIILLSQNILRRINQLTNLGSSLEDFGQILWTLLPMLTSYAFPIALVLGTLLALQRMNSDGEILAMRAHGIGLGPLALPALMLAVLAALISAWLILSVEHRARSELIASLAKNATKGGMIRPGQFTWVGPRRVFVDERDRSGELSGVVIFDYSYRQKLLRIFAERGALEWKPEALEINLTLWNGEVAIQPQDAPPTEDRHIEFERLIYTFDITNILGRDFSPTRPRQMNLEQLRTTQAKLESGEGAKLDLHERNPVEYALEGQRRFAAPLAPLWLIMAAIPLGTNLRARGKAWGLLLCGVLIGAYYLLTLFAQMLARNLWLDAITATWIPAGLFGGVGLFLLIRAWRGHAP